MNVTATWSRRNGPPCFLRPPFRECHGRNSFRASVSPLFERRRTVKMRLLLASFALICLASPHALEGGDKDKKKDDPFAGATKPGPEHKMLAKLEGTWDARVK